MYGRKVSKIRFINVLLSEGQDGDRILSDKTNKGITEYSVRNKTARGKEAADTVMRRTVSMVLAIAILLLTGCTLPGTDAGISDGQSPEPTSLIIIDDTTGATGTENGGQSSEPGNKGQDEDPGRPGDEGQGSVTETPAPSPTPIPLNERMVVIGESKRIPVVNLLQEPELPSGCEAVSLTILLNYLGFSVDKMTIACKYLPQLDFYGEENDLHGADFRTTFAGDPTRLEHSYGCYAPCITITANAYFEDNGYSARAYDITGADFDSLLTDYIDKGMPVLIWATSGNLRPSKLTDLYWTTPEGEVVRWLAYQHCIVLTGYDLENNRIYVSDPQVGNTAYSYDILKERYLELGRQAIHIVP